VLKVVGMNLVNCWTAPPSPALVNTIVRSSTLKTPVQQYIERSEAAYEGPLPRTLFYGGN
jgi:hypothetical protein